MRFTVSSSALSSKLNMLVKVIGSKNSLPILENFLFQIESGELNITASDSDNIIKSSIALTECEGEGEFCVPTRVVIDALKELPEQPLSFEVEKTPTLTPSRSYIRMVFITSPVSMPRTIHALSLWATDAPSSPFPPIF